MRCMILLVFLFAVSCSPQMEVEKKVEVDFPSGSAITSLNGDLYLAGDDVNYILVLDSLLNIKDRIFLIDTSTARVPKDRKQDLESASLMKIRGVPVLFFAGSGSLDTNRMNGWMVYPFKKEKILIPLDTFFRRLQHSALKELNVEGMAITANAVIFSNRGHLENRKNHLVFTSPDFWKKQTAAPLRIVKVGNNADSNSFQGVSGLEYSKKTDNLLLTVSTEQTSSTYQDGAIGKSYLWIVHNITSKRRMAAINPNRIIDLEEMNAEFKGQKIESVTIISETRKEMLLVLVADNDDGKSTLFKVRLRN
jgi:hypothetical protein